MGKQVCIATTVNGVLASWCISHLVYKMGDEHVLCLVQARVNNRGYPFINLMRQNSDLMKWIVDTLGATLDAEYDICCWEYGSH